jgi:small subunit ribosomal protein S20
MANIKAAKKYIKITKRNRKRNLSITKNLKGLIKKAETAIKNASGDVQAAIQSAIKALDKAAGKGIIHINKAARKKSRLIRKSKKK